MSSVFVLAACESRGPVQTTEVNRVLKAPNIESLPFDTILVVGAAPSRETMRRIEVGFMQELEKHKVRAYSFVRDSEALEPSEEAIMALVEETGADAILIVSGQLGGSALTQQNETIAADVQVQVRGQDLFNFFRYDYVDIKRATYSDFTTNVEIVSDLYETSSKERIYSVESNTEHGGTGYQIIVAEAKIVVDRMKKDRIIR
jgi:hypothetical protein